MPRFEKYFTVKPVSILKIEDKNGSVIYENHAESKEVLSPETTNIIRSMMQDVINRGTGYAIRRDYKFTEPAGGKTGTTNGFTDAWFVGYTPDIVSGIWVGLDDPKQSLGPGMAGGRVALPFWGDFMTSVYDSVSFNRGRFVDSPGVFKLEICKETKQLATAYCPDTIEEMFTANNRHEETCQVHKGLGTGNNKRRRTF